SQGAHRATGEGSKNGWQKPERLSARQKTEIVLRASITVSATFGHSAQPDNVTCWHIISCNGWCPSIAWMKGLRSVISRLLIESIAKAGGHRIAQQFLQGPHMVRQTCRHSRCDGLPLLG